MNQQTKITIKSLLLVLGFVGTISAFAFWNGPTVGPLGDNVSAPINTGSITQSKNSGIVAAYGRFQGLLIADQNVTIGGKLDVASGVKIGGTAGQDGTQSYNASAALDITSTNQGLLLPRMTQAQRDAIRTPVAGLVIYQTNNIPGIRIYNGVAWTGYSVAADGLLP